MNPQTRKPRNRDAVRLDGRDYQVTGEAITPERGVWLGREGGTVVCERFVPLSAWTLVWDTQAERWGTP